MTLTKTYLNKLEGSKLYMTLIDVVRNEKLTDADIMWLYTFIPTEELYDRIWAMFEDRYGETISKIRYILNSAKNGVYIKTYLVKENED